MRRVLILIVVLIVYGSLYPWHFAPAHLAASPLRALAHSWRPYPLRYFLSDLIVNTALYVPLGFAAHSAFRKSRLPGFTIYGPVLLGLLLSTAMELMQLLEPARHASIADVISNVFGSGIGVMAALLFEGLASRDGSIKPGQIRHNAVTDRSALLLSFCWAAWLFFPLFPEISPYQLHRKLVLFEHSRVVDPMLLMSTAACWYAAGLLVTASGARIPRAWFPLTLLAIPAQFFVVERQPVPSFLLGGIVGVILFLAIHRAGTPKNAEAWAFLAVIAVRGLSPFRFVAGSTEFSWIPFVTTLAGEWQSAAGVLIEKIFYYGAAIWLLRAGSSKWVRSVIVVAAALASIEITQIHLPGRTPEATDPILALLMGFVLAMLSPDRLKGQARRTPPVE